MCNLSDVVKQEGREEGYDAQARLVEQIMKKQDWSLEEVFANFEFPEIEKEAIRLRLQPAN